MRQRHFLLTAALAAFAVAAPATAFSAEYYAGKTINFVVPYNPGGSTDANWRTIAPYMAKHIPGNPTVVIQNKPGAGGMNASNFVYESAKPDGTTLLTGPWNAIGSLIKAPGVRLDYTKMPFIGGFPEFLMTFARTDVGDGKLAKPEDIVKAKSLSLGGLRPDSSMDLVGRLSLELLGVDLKYVPGYAGGGKRTAAVLSGEVQATSIGYNAFVSSIEPSAGKSGDVVGLYYHSLNKSPSIDDMMDFPRFYEKVKGQKPSGEKWQLLRTVYLATGVFLQGIFAPPGTPDEAVAALRTGYLRMAKDPEIQAEAKKRFGGGYDFVDPKEGESVMTELLSNPDTKTVEDLKAYIAAGKN